jgi:hypothetical protein
MPIRLAAGTYCIAVREVSYWLRRPMASHVGDHEFENSSGGTGEWKFVDRVRIQNQDRAGLGGFVATGSPAKSHASLTKARAGALLSNDITRNAKEVSTGNADTPIAGLSTPSWASC